MKQNDLKMESSCQNFLGCSNGDLRLVDGNGHLEGRVEICYDGVWGTVCSDHWGRAEVSVVCRHLGYSSSGSVILPESQDTRLHDSLRWSSKDKCTIWRRCWSNHFG